MKPLAEPGRFRIKQAAVEQLLDAARMKAAAWRETYPLPDEALDLIEAAATRTADYWQEQVRAGAYFWIVVDTAHDSEIVGVSNAAVGRDLDAPTPLELTMIYLLDVAKGSGIADRLLEMTIGDAPAYLWVMEGNDRAVAFYRRHGFELDGERRDMGGALEGHTEVRMVRGL